MDVVTYALSRKYTDISIKNLSGLKGADCRIESVTPTQDGNDVVFAWINANGNKETTTLSVKNGVSIDNVIVDTNNNVIVELSDGTSITAGSISTIKGDKGDKGDDGFSPTVSVVDVNSTHTVSITDVNGTKSFVVKDGNPADLTNYYDKNEVDQKLSAKADSSNIPVVPTNLSAFTNDTNFIDNTVNNLINYYNKADIYTKTEVHTLISNIDKLTAEIVQTLPTTSISTSVIYLVPVSGKQNEYSQYMYINSAWALLGSTNVDLTNYYNKTEIDNKLSYKADTSSIPVVPTNVSQFTNDAGYITGYTETDPTVPAWAKQSTKPKYTAQEVGALPDSTVIPVFTNKSVLDNITSNDVTNWNDSATKAHEHTNKAVIDKFSDVNGTVLYDGKAISGGADIDDTTTSATNKTWSAKKINDNIANVDSKFKDYYKTTDTYNSTEIDNFLNNKADKLSSAQIVQGQILVDDGNGNISGSGSKVSDYLPAWKGTMAEWQSFNKTNLADGAVVNITDDYNNNSIQMAVMPTTANTGDIVQYIGTTTANYTNGYFYKWNGTVWTNISIMDASNYNIEVTDVDIGTGVPMETGKIVFVVDTI